MMRGAGDYPVRLKWLGQVAGTPDTFGQKPGARRFLEGRAPDYPVKGYVWAAIEDVSANVTTMKASDRQEIAATIRVRNWPAIGPGDQLVDERFNEVYTVSTWVRGDNELIVEVLK